MSTNRRYNPARSNVNNLTFTGQHSRGGGQTATKEGEPQQNINTHNRKDPSPSRSDYGPRLRGKPRYGSDKGDRRDPQQEDFRYHPVSEQDEHSLEEDVMSTSHSETQLSRRRGRWTTSDDEYDEDGVDGTDVVNEEERDDWTRSGYLEDPDGEDSSCLDKLFMTEEQMLQQSTDELLATIEELESRFDNIENEGNEWKTRFETQQESNQQLERQIILQQSKLEEAKANLRDVNKSPRESKHSDDLSHASPLMIKASEREKNLLISQLRDLEWRLDQESKAYHRANDERKHFVVEINGARTIMNRMKTRRQKLMLHSVGPQHDGGSATSRTYRDTTGNIPNDQRIIDPKRGPIKRTAGVKSLPSLEPEY